MFFLAVYKRQDIKLAVEVERMEPLFKDEQEYDAFIKEHNQFKVKKADLATYSGKCYLGIDEMCIRDRSIIADRPYSIRNVLSSSVISVRFSLRRN